METPTMPSKRFNIRLPESTDEKLRDLAEARGKNLTDTVVDLIELAAANPDFFNTLKAEPAPRYQWLDDSCPLLYYLDDEEAPKPGEGFYCLEKAPKATLLGSGINTAAKKYCEACQFKKGIIAKNIELTKTLAEGFTVRIPFCANGGKITNDLQRIWCPISTTHRPVTKCKTLKNGASCQHLKWIDATAQRPQTSQKERR